jgi:hypothetical protein
MSAATKSLVVLIAFVALIPARVAVAADATLYELSEEMSIDGRGHRIATSSFQGTASLGTPLCPYVLANMLTMTTGVSVKSCTVSGLGWDDVDANPASRSFGTGVVGGTFAVVINADNIIDAPEYVVMTGKFNGRMMLTAPADLKGKRQSLGPTTQRILLTDGVFTPENIAGFSPEQLAAFLTTSNPDPTGLDPAYLAGVVRTLGVSPANFSGVFRLPFAMSEGQKEKPRKDRDANFYLSDEEKLIKVRKDERALGYPTVRIEVNFER